MFQERNQITANPKIGHSESSWRKNSKNTTRITKSFGSLRISKKKRIHRVNASKRRAEISPGQMSPTNWTRNYKRARIRCINCLWDSIISTWKHTWKQKKSPNNSMTSGKSWDSEHDRWQWINNGESSVIRGRSDMSRETLSVRTKRETEIKEDCAQF